MYVTPLTKAQDEAICAWHELQPEEFLNALHELFPDGLTPRQAYIHVFGSLPGQKNQSARLVASAEVGQAVDTITCAACGSTNTESCCHPAEFCQAICNDCNTSLNADGSVWVEKQEPAIEQFQCWMENRAHEAKHWYDNLSSEGLSDSEFSMLRSDFARVFKEARSAVALLRQFKREQGA